MPTGKVPRLPDGVKITSGSVVSVTGRLWVCVFLSLRKTFSPECPSVLSVRGSFLWEGVVGRGRQRLVGAMTYWFSGLPMWEPVFGILDYRGGGGGEGWECRPDPQAHLSDYRISRFK